MSRDKPKRQQAAAALVDRAESLLSQAAEILKRSHDRGWERLSVLAAQVSDFNNDRL